MGSETRATLPLFNLWTLSWNGERIPHLWFGYWDTPIFYPHAGAFGLSDPQPLTELLFAIETLFISNSFLPTISASWGSSSTVTAPIGSL